MNERIREIERQSGLEIYGLGARRDKWEQCIEKFTRMVVEECVKAVDETNTHHVHTTFDDNLVRTTMSKTKTAIKQHFGVE